MGYYSPCGCQQPDTPERLNSDTATTTATMESVTVRMKWEISCCLVFFSSFFDSGVTWYFSVNTDGAYPTLESGGAVDFPGCGWGQCVDISAKEAERLCLWRRSGFPPSGFGSC